MVNFENPDLQQNLTNWEKVVISFEVVAVREELAKAHFLAPAIVQKQVSDQKE